MTYAGVLAGAEELPVSRLPGGSAGIKTGPRHAIPISGKDENTLQGWF